MNQGCLVYIAPYNWYDHVTKGQINRPLKMAEQLYNHNFFRNVLIVNRIHPKRTFHQFESGRMLVEKKFVFNIFYDAKNEVYYLEHCLPFGVIETNILPLIIKHFLKKINQKKCFLWISDPKSLGIILKFKESIVLFDAYDDWSISPFYKRKKRHLKYINRGYNLAKNFCRLIITNTKHMQNKLSNNNNRVVLIGNTTSILCNYSSTERKKSRNNEMLNIKRVGYIGNLHERIDLDLLKFIVGKFNKVIFCFIGENCFQTEGFNKLLKENSNIRFLGPKPYKDIPKYLECFDACIIPHLVNNYTMSQDSMKVYDYLALGKPVVSTEVPPADRLSSLLYLAFTKEDFAKKLKLALNENDNNLKLKRINYIKINSWKNKVKHICRIMED